MRVIFWATLLACSGDDPADGGPTTDESTDGATPSGDTSNLSSTADTSSSASTGDTGPSGVTFDCDTIPTFPTSVTQIPGASGYHDVAFSPDGYIIGSGQGFSGNLFKALYANPKATLFAPNVGTAQQMVWLPDGDLAVASDTRGILRVSVAGSSTVINPDIHPYGLILGPDDMLYSADESVVHRVDPLTGQSEVLVPRNALTRGSPRVLNFNLDYTKLYMGTLGGTNGRIYVVDVDKNLDPVGTPVEFASGVGTGSYHDSLGIDVCGYLYVADYSRSALYRISPSGQVQKLWEDSGGFFNSEYGHGVEWGNGVGGWLEEAIYLPQPYNQNQVMEMVIGVPSRHWTGGTAINLP